MDDTKLVICEKCCGTGYVSGGNENSTWSKTCEYCHGIGFSRIPMTNADRIRAMSDEQLAEYVGKICLCSHIQDIDIKHCDARAVCTNCIVEWLKKPAK